MTQHTMPPAVILLDNMSQLLVLQQYLTPIVGDACSIVLTHNPETVLHHLETREVPVIMTEQETWGSSAITGLELAQEIKRRSPLTTVILTTAHHSAELERQAKQANVDIYLIKPVPLERVAQLVQEGVTRYFQQREKLTAASSLTLEMYAPSETDITKQTPDDFDPLMQALDAQITAIQGQMYGLVGALIVARKRDGVPSLRWMHRLKQFDTECQGFVAHLHMLATQIGVVEPDIKEVGKAPS